MSSFAINKKDERNNNIKKITTENLLEILIYLINEKKGILFFFSHLVKSSVQYSSLPLEKHASLSSL